MNPYVMNYGGYVIEIYEHPEFHDFEFVIKQQNGRVVTSSIQQYEFFEDAEVAAKMIINNF
jgi:hypothetical protein